MLSCGVIAAAGLTLLTEAYRIAEANVVAPFEYTAILWGVAYGWAFWRDWPDPTAWLGIAVDRRRRALRAVARARGAAAALMSRGRRRRRFRAGAPRAREPGRTEAGGMVGRIIETQEDVAEGAA